MPETTRWIFLRGLMRDARHWGRFPEVFAARVSPASITMIDFAGNGRRFGDRSHRRVGDMVEECRREARESAGPPPYYVFGLSLGAMVAAAWASQFPAELAGCVLVNTSLRPFSPPQWRLRPAAWPAALGLVFLPLSVRQRERMVLSITSSQHTGDTALIELWAEWFLTQPVSRANGLRQLAAAAAYRAQASPPRVPVLVLSSAGDALVDPRCSQRLARQWGAALRVHPIAGHDLPLDDGEWVAEQSALWLADNPSVLGQVSLERVDDSGKVSATTTASGQ